MRILALDISTRRTGWACGESSQAPSFGCHGFPQGDRGVGRLSAAYDTWLLSMLDMHRPELVIFEKPLPTISGRTNFMTKYKLGGLCFMTEWRCHVEETRCVWKDNGAVKKHFAGRAGFGKKADPYPMTEAAHQRGWKVGNDDEADACGLWSYAVSCYAPDDAYRHEPLMAGA